MITIKHQGSFNNTEKFLKGAQRLNIRKILENYGWQGVKALSLATPVHTGLTASSWEYKISITQRGCKLTWLNTNAENGMNVAILIQYGHGTRNGGYVQGIDYINPAIRPIFEKLAESLREEVSRL